MEVCTEGVDKRVALMKYGRRQNFQEFMIIRIRGVRERKAFRMGRPGFHYLDDLKNDAVTEDWGILQEKQVF